jgi:Protein of unknown function (DUF3631)/Domain of unknown function (DUF3854)
MTDFSTRRLSDAHREALRASAISDDVIDERGYFTLRKKLDLAGLGFGPSLQFAPTLVVPSYGVVPGEPPWYLHRPDDTPVKNGRPCKYLIPKGRRMALDVHPRVHAGLGARVPLFVCEGAKKTDAIVTAGAEAAVGLVGTWTWRGTNHDGGKTLLPDWEWVALKDGRQVYVVFDSDVMLKPEVYNACTRLGAMLGRQGADVAYVYLPSGAGGVKVGADDFLASGKKLADIVALAAPELRQPLVEDDESGPGTAVVFPDPKPWDEPVSGTELAGEITETIQRHVVLSEAEAIAAALWALLTHVHDSTPISPLLAVLSPTWDCGKSTLLDVLEEVVARPLSTSNITGPALFRVIEKYRPTLLIDEADSFFTENEGLRGIIDSGHTPKRAFTLRTVGDGAESDVRRFSTWSPKVFAMIGNPAGTILSRSIPIRLERKRPDDEVEDLDVDDDRYADLCRRAYRWGQDFPTAAAGRPTTPAPGRNRLRDNWRPLLSIAETIGGDWPELARDAAVALSGGDDDGALDDGALLLADLHQLFRSPTFDDAEGVWTDTILTALLNREDRPWREYGRDRRPLTAHGLARLLKPFKVRPHNVRVGDEQRKGYRRKDLDPAWERYLPDAQGGDEE